MIYDLIWKLISKRPFLVEKKRSVSGIWKNVIPVPDLVSNQDRRYLPVKRVVVPVLQLLSLVHHWGISKHNKPVPVVVVPVNVSKNIVPHVLDRVWYRKRNKSRSLSRQVWKMGTSYGSVVKVMPVPTVVPPVICISF